MRTSAFLLRLFILFFTVAGATAVSASDLRALRLHDRMMTKLGGSALEEASTVGFDFVVRESGIERLRRSHLWDRTTNEYRIELPAQGGGTCTVWFDLDVPHRGVATCGGSPIGDKRASALLEAAYRAHINDFWWLAMPFKWRDPGVQLTYIGKERSGKTRWDVVLLRFSEGTGLTSDDRYWAYVDRETGRMDKWEMILQGATGPAKVVGWTGWEEIGGVQISTKKEIEGSDRSITLEKITISSARFPERFAPTVGAKVIATQTKPSARPAPEASLSKNTAPVAGTTPRVKIAPPVPVPPKPKPAPSTPPKRDPFAKVEPPDTPVQEEVLVGKTTPAQPRLKGRLLVLNKADNDAVLLDAADMSVLSKTPTGAGPHEVAVSPDAKRGFVTNYGHSQGGNTISVLDLSSGALKVVDTWDLGKYERPHGLQFDANGDLWVTAETAKAVVVLDGQDGKVKRVVETGQNVSHMIALAASHKKAFVANIGSGNVSVLPMQEGTVKQIEVGNGPEGIAVTPKGDEVWVANRYEDEVVILDARTEKIKDRLPTGDFPIRVSITPDGRRAVISNVRSADLWIYDVATRKLVSTINVGGAPIGVLIPPSADRVFVALPQEGVVKAIDLANGTVLGEARTGSQPDGMAWVAVSSN